MAVLMTRGVPRRVGVGACLALAAGLVVSDIQGADRATSNSRPEATAGKSKTNAKDGADMVFVPPGEFTMGSSDYDEEKPVHRVMLDGYYIYRTPVTVAQYVKFCDKTGRPKPPAPDFNLNWSKRDHPIVNVSYDDALAYCAWAGGDKAGSVRLPSEAEWEKAARGVNGRRFPWGEAFDRSRLWCSASTLGDAGGTKPVGSFPSGVSPFGALDMAGNVWQWCSDWYDKDYYSRRPATERNPENQSVGEKKERVLRGGAWDGTNPDIFRCANRINVTPDGRLHVFGFRCASAP
jgi:formylglycine-generating enzyme required for sulfatase activity